VSIEWADGASTEISGRHLRSACPCADCGNRGQVAVSFIEIGGRTTIADAQLIGGYAIRFTFGDGHADGIYPYHLLRSLGGAE